MSTYLLDQVLHTLGLHPASGEHTPSGGMSGASLVRAETAAGERVMVKVSALDTEISRDQSTRELTVYTELTSRHAIPTPRLITSHRAPAWLAIALTVHEPAPPAPQWTVSHWEELARMLARMHGEVQPVPALLQHHRPERAVPQRELQTFAQHLWNGPGDDERIRAVLADLDQLEEVANSGPASFVHGDCHPGNVLHDENGRLLLVDWQSSGVGPSAGDLAFAFTRAVPTGAEIPRDRAIAAYCEEAGVDGAQTQRRITARQILTLVTQYPEFAGFLGEPEVRRLRAELDALLQRWTTRG